MLLLRWKNMAHQTTEERVLPKRPSDPPALFFPCSLLSPFLIKLQPSDTRTRLRRAGAGMRRALPLIEALGRHRFRHCGLKEKQEFKKKNGLKSRSVSRLSWDRFRNIQDKLSCCCCCFVLSFDSCGAADEHHRSGGELSSSTQIHHQNLFTLTKTCPVLIGQSLQQIWPFLGENAPKRTEGAAEICFEVLNCWSLDSKDSRNPIPSSLIAG